MGLYIGLPRTTFRLSMMSLQVITRAMAIDKPPVDMKNMSAEDFKKSVVADEKEYVLQTYGRPEDLVITHGKGSRMWDVTGKEYIDFAAGIAVNALGHSNPIWYNAVVEQAGHLAHTSNLFHTVPQVLLRTFL